MAFLAILHSEEMDTSFVMLVIFGIHFHQTGVRNVQELRKG
jgi:hypothetical protein